MMDPDETHEDFSYDEAEEEDVSEVEREVKINWKAEIYTVTSYPGGMVTSFGWDHVLDRIERLTLAFGEPEVPEVARGSIEAWDLMVMLQERAQRHYDETGEVCVADLSPGLSGLEGHRVEVVDRHGETRRFIVGQSYGCFPVHLELARKGEPVGPPADIEGYQEIRDLGPVR